MWDHKNLCGKYYENNKKLNFFAYIYIYIYVCMYVCMYEII